MTTPTPPHVRPDSGDSADNANAAPLPRWKKWLFTLVMLTIVVGGLQLAAYAYLRAFQGYDGKHLSQFEFDPYKNLLPTRNYVDTRGIRHNSAGFRRSTDVSPEKAPGTIRVFLMGASTGYGLGGLWPHVEPNYPVLAHRDRGVALMSEFLDAHGFAAEIRTASDPFFVAPDEALAKTYFQLSSDTKYEIAAYLPDGSQLAVASLNYHSDFFGKVFDCLAGDGGPMHSVCFGFGLERWVHALLAQHGSDPMHWPAPLRAAIENGPPHR